MSGDQAGRRQPPCPCCHGLPDGETFDLCDLCVAAALAGKYPHGCRRQVATDDARPTS